MLAKITLIIICKLLLRQINAKVIMLDNLEFKTNGVPNNLMIDEENPVNSSDKKDNEEEFKPGKSQEDSADEIKHISSELEVTTNRNDTQNDPTNIEEDLKDIEDVIKLESDHKNELRNLNNITKIRIMLKRIKKMLKKEEKRVRNENFRSYVPISDDVENAEIIPRVLDTAVFQNGLTLFNQGSIIHDMI